MDTIANSPELMEKLAAILAQLTKNQAVKTKSILLSSADAMRELGVSRKTLYNLFITHRELKPNGENSRGYDPRVVAELKALRANGLRIKK